MVYETFISPHDLQQNFNRPDWLIFDCSFYLNASQQAQQEYDQQHIPGAFYAHLNNDLSAEVTKHSGYHPLPDKQKFLKFMIDRGLQDNVQVIAYDNFSGGFAARLWWLVRSLGHKAVAVLDGGLANWRRLGFALDNLSPIATKGKFTLKEPLTATIDISEVKNNLQKNEFLLIDSRSVDRYSGENEPLYSVAGHIPGAQNIFFGGHLDGQGLLKDKNQLRTEFAKVLKDQQASQSVFYCGSGVTACFNILVSQHIGQVGAKLYPGSWSQWISYPELPVAIGLPEK